MDRDQKSNVDERSSTFRLQYVLCFTETQWIACKLKFIDATVFFPSIFYFFFSAAKRHADMTKSAKSLRLPEGGIYPGEALCLISPFGVSEMRYPRRGGPFVIWAQWLICERALPYPSRGGPEDVTATDGRTDVGAVMDASVLPVRVIYATIHRHQPVPRCNTSYEISYGR